MKFSLLNLFLALTAIAAIVGLYSARQANVEAARRYEKEIAELEADHEYVAAENKYLRQELGCLTITEPTKLHAVKVRTDQPKTWSYRVHLPEGRQYYFACQINLLPLGGAPPLVANPPGPNTIGSLGNNSVCIGRPPGKYIVTLSINLVDNKWKYRMNVRKSGDAGDGSVSGSVIEDVDGKWPMLKGAIASQGVFNQTEISLDKSPLVLLNFRVMNGGVISSRRSKQGCMLWVGTSD